MLAESPLLKRVVAMLTDGSIPDIQLEGRQIVDSLVLGNDEYFVLADFAAYQAASRRVEQRYADPAGWAQTMAINIAAAGQFAADFTRGQLRPRNLGRAADPPAAGMTAGTQKRTDPQDRSVFTWDNQAITMRSRRPLVG